MDQDQSGSITIMELYKFIIKVSKIENADNAEEVIFFDQFSPYLTFAFKVNWEDVRSIFKNLDKDGDKNVEWEEFFVR